MSYDEPSPIRILCSIWKCIKGIGGSVQSESSLVPLSLHPITSTHLSFIFHLLASIKIRFLTNQFIFTWPNWPTAPHMFAPSWSMALCVQWSLSNLYFNIKAEILDAAESCHRFDTESYGQPDVSVHLRWHFDSEIRSDIQASRTAYSLAAHIDSLKTLQPAPVAHFRTRIAWL